MLGFGHQWTAVEGAIIARQEVANDPQGQCPVFKYVVELRLPDGPATRVEVHEPAIATDFRHPSEGETVGFELDVKSGKVRFDKSDPRLSRKAHETAEKRAEQLRFEQQLKR